MPSLNVPQAQFLQLPHKFKAFVGGFGSGKTWVGCAGLCRHAWEFPRINAGYFAPTFGQIRDIFYPTIEEVASDWGLTVRVNTSNREVHLYSGSIYRCTIICRSMDDPGKIVGFKIGKGLVDELDVMRLVDAQLAWRKIIGRMRQVAPGLLNGIDVTTTPEGFKFVHQQFVTDPLNRPDMRALYGMVQSSTYQNAKNLPADYIPSLLASYPPQLVRAYLRGLFVNLTSGSVYPDFDRNKNRSNDVLQEGEPVHVGMDFNVLNMTAILLVIRDGSPVAVGELTGVRDTPEMARLLKERFKDKGHTVTVYPDASGQNTSSRNASESDLTILRGAGLIVRSNPSNPAVRDRLNTVNGMILNSEGARRLKVNTDRCPILTAALEQQPYGKNGEPDKSSGHDHPNDALGYFLVDRFPIVKRVASVSALRM